MSQDADDDQKGHRKRGSLEMKEDIVYNQTLTPLIQSPKEVSNPTDDTPRLLLGVSSITRSTTLNSFDLPSDEDGADKEKPAELTPSKKGKSSFSRRAKGKGRDRRRGMSVGAINFNPNGTSPFPSNAAVIAMMQNELPPSERNEMQNKSNDLQLQRELQHALVKLSETQEQCATAVEIIGNLQKENEDLQTENETLRTELGAMSTECKILEEKIKSIQDSYTTDSEKYKSQVQATNQKLNALKEDMTNKDLQLNEVKQYQKSMQQKIYNRYGTIGFDGDNADATGISTQHMSKKEKEFYEKLQKEKKKTAEKDERITELYQEVQSMNALKKERDKMSSEISNLNEMAQEDLMEQMMKVKKMEREVISLASRNSALEKEKDDLLALLEEREYETQMLKTGFGLHRNQTNGMHMQQNSILPDGVFHPEDGDDDNIEYNETLENLYDQAPITLADMESDEDYAPDIDYDGEYQQTKMNYSRSGSKGNSEKEKIKEKPKGKAVPDVTREYLHLTASVVNMKFPRIQNISSEELISKVSNFHFWEYHDMMVELMQVEMKKILDKDKAESDKKMMEAKQRQMAGKPMKQSEKKEDGGILSGFRSWFGSSKPTRNSVSKTQQRSRGSVGSNKGKGNGGSELKNRNVGDARKKEKQNAQRNNHNKNQNNNNNNNNKNRKKQKYANDMRNADAHMKKYEKKKAKSPSPASSGSNSGRSSSKAAQSVTKKVAKMKNRAMHQPSENSTHRMAQMEFQSVGSVHSTVYDANNGDNNIDDTAMLGPKKKVKKVKKPQQTL